MMFDFVPDWLERRSKLSPMKVALVDLQDESRRITYQEWNARVNQTARFLAEGLGARKGDRIAVLAHNSVEYLDIWFALMKTGGILQNLNWRLAPGELVQLIQEASPAVLVYDNMQGEFSEVIASIRNGLGHPLQMVSIGEPLALEDHRMNERERYSIDPVSSIEVSAEDPWVICYTGGTTGLPKGAVLSYRAVAANAVNTITSWGLSPEDTTILNAPLFHTGGLNVFTAPLVYLGGTSLVCRDFDLEQTFDLLESGDVTVWFGVPTMFIMMQNHPRWKNADFSKLRFIISGGAPCPLPVFERFWEKGVDFKTGYGLTEAGPNTFWLPPGQVQEKPGAVGYPLLNVDVRLAGEDGHECENGAVGELLIRGPHLFSGYWKAPEATEQAMRGGWLHTGDLAVRDEDGAYTIVGRSKDMIISGGENIYPAEIESVLHGHPAVAEAAVIGVPDEKWGEVGWAIIVLRPDAQVREDIFAEYCRPRLARFKIPKRFLFKDELPRTGANKIDKHSLREQILNETYR